MKFIHFTDTHIKAYYGDGKMDEMMSRLPSPAANLEKALQEIDWTDIDFIVFTGDLIHEGGVADYQVLKAIVQEQVPSQVEVIYVLGNHDKKPAFYEAIEGEAKETPYYYTKEIEGYRLIVLDSAIANKSSGKITKEQMNWLRETLNQPAPKGSIIFLHHPIFWNGPAVFEEALLHKEEVLEVLEKSDVLGVFCGHTHMNAVHTWKHITQYTSDSAAFSLEIRDKDQLAFTEKNGYIVAEVRQGHINAHFETIHKANAIVSIPMKAMAQAIKDLEQE